MEMVGERKMRSADVGQVVSFEVGALNDVLVLPYGLEHQSAPCTLIMDVH